MKLRCEWVFLCLGLIVTSAVAEDDVRKAYNSICFSNYNARTLSAVFDLDQPGPSAFLLEKMNAKLKEMPNGCDCFPMEVMAAIFRIDPRKGYEWFVTNYEQLSAVGRGSMAQCLVSLDRKEAYEALVELLSDKETVINPLAAKWAPGPYTHLRVCDHAYNSLDGKIRIGKVRARDMPRTTLSFESLEPWDEAISKFTNWWPTASAEILSKRESFGTNAPSLKETIVKHRAAITAAASTARTPIR